MQAPQRFSACLSVPGFAWLDRTDSTQASACWSVSVGGVLRDLVEGPMRHSLTFVPPPAATLEALPKSTIWRAGLMRDFPGFSRHGTHRSVLPNKSPYGSLGRMAIFPGFS